MSPAIMSEGRPGGGLRPDPVIVILLPDGDHLMNTKAVASYLRANPDLIRHWLHHRSPKWNPFPRPELEPWLLLPEDAEAQQMRRSLGRRRFWRQSKIDRWLRRMAHKEALAFLQDPANKRARKYVDRKRSEKGPVRDDLRRRYS